MESKYKYLLFFIYEKVTDVLANHGAQFLRHFGDSLPNALRALFPELNWKEFLFTHRSPKNFDADEAIEYINYLEERLCISKWQEWVDISVQHVIRFGGSSLVVGYGHRGLINFLNKKYPDVTFSEFDFKNSLLKTQKLIYRIMRYAQVLDNNSIRNLFPDYAAALQFNARHPKMVFKESQQNMSLDIFIEPLNLAIEYQGIHHSNDTRFFGPSQIQKVRE